MLDTTQYNYRELSKMYKEQMQYGTSKMLAQIALGQSQSFILNSCIFENEILKLHEIMIPPISSNTMSSSSATSTKEDSKSLDKEENSNSSKKQNIIEDEKKDAGRPEKSETEKSDKTLANQESMN